MNLLLIERLFLAALLVFCVVVLFLFFRKTKKDNKQVHTFWAPGETGPDRALSLLILEIKERAVRGTAELLVLNYLTERPMRLVLIYSQLRGLGLDDHSGSVGLALHRLWKDGLVARHEELPNTDDTTADARESLKRFTYNITPLGAQVRDRLNVAVLQPLSHIFSELKAQNPLSPNEAFLRTYRDYPSTFFDVNNILSHLRELPAGARPTVRACLDSVAPARNSDDRLLPAFFHLMAAGIVKYRPADSGNWLDAQIWTEPSLPSVS